MHKTQRAQKRKRTKNSIATRFCRCIKQVRRNTTQKQEQRAIAICVSSLLHRKGRTLRRFRCKKRPYLTLQPRLHKG